MHREKEGRREDRNQSVGYPDYRTQERGNVGWTGGDRANGLGGGQPAQQRGERKNPARSQQWRMEDGAESQHYASYRPGSERQNVRCTQRALGGGFTSAVAVVPTKGKRRANTGVFLDSGSVISFISKDLVRKLGGGVGNYGSEKKLEITTIDGTKELVCSVLHGVTVVGEGGSAEIELPPLYVVQEIPGGSDGLSRECKWRDFPHLAEIHIVEPSKVELLLGSDVPAALEPVEVANAPTAGEPFAWRSRLGWVFCTGRRGEQRGKGVPVNRITLKSQEEFLDQVKKVFEVEFDGSNDEGMGLSVEDRQWKKVVDEGCTKVGKQYEIPLPFRRNEPVMPFSKGVAKKRALALRKKLQADYSFKLQYAVAMEEMLREGYCSRARGEIEDERHVWYIPHFGVRTKEETRIVFDCAARSCGACLNDFLIQGPDVNSLLCNVLLRFRQCAVAYMADIKAMFYQVKVPEHQRRYMRFWWWLDQSLEGEPVEFEMNVHVFGAVSSPSVAMYALRRTVADCEWCSESVQKVFHLNFYVDDCLRACADIPSAKKELADVTSVCAEGGFNLHKFVSNRTEVVPRGEEQPMCKALGVR